jgi:ADP-heptose:LPS heptosyltransferase
MSTLKKINIYRRKITKTITSNIGKSTSSESKIKFIEKDNVNRILICRPNHRLGNMLLITPIVQEAINKFPNAKIDLFVKGNIASIVFENYKEVDKVIALPKQHFKNLGTYLMYWLHLKMEKYDLVINCVEYSSSGKLSTRFSRAKHKFYGTNFVEDSHEINIDEKNHIAKKTVYGLRTFLSKHGVTIENDNIPNLDLKLTANELKEGKEIVNKLTKNNKETITIFTYATGEKCYSKEWWNTFYELLKLNFPDYNIIEILPAEKVSNINYQAPSFYSKDLRQIGSIIANSKIFIGADSGMMHLASASQTKTIGLFCVTKVETYKPYGNGSLAIDTNKYELNNCIDIIRKSLLN